MRYPTLEELLCADLDQCVAWSEGLPAAETDVERTVRRRLTVRLDRLMRQGVREHVPEFADKFNDLADRVEGLMRAPFGTFKRM
jgi:hypothetical protein